MAFYEIAGLRIAMDCQGEILSRQSETYRRIEPVFDTGQFCRSSASTLLNPQPDITLQLAPEDRDQFAAQQPHLTRDQVEYLALGAQFYENLLDHDGFLLHAAGLAFAGRACLFAAGCGVGKSTHARLWQSYFGPDRVTIINDDKPALRYFDGQWQACGTPFSGKTDSNTNIQVPLQAICFLEQAAVDWIEPVTAREAIPLLLAQTLRPALSGRMNRLLQLCDQLLPAIPIYRMGATLSTSAVTLAYRTLLQAQPIARQ
jgi:hypothetical protein